MPSSPESNRSHPDLPAFIRILEISRRDSEGFVAIMDLPIGLVDARLLTERVRPESDTPVYGQYELDDQAVDELRLVHGVDIPVGEEFCYVLSYRYEGDLRVNYLYDSDSGGEAP